MWWFVFALAVHSFISTERVLNAYLDQCVFHECDLILFDPAHDCELMMDERPRPNVPMVFVDVSTVKSMRDSFKKPHTRLVYGGRRSLQQTNFFDYESVRGSLADREYKLLITGKPHPDLAHAAFALHAADDPVDHVVVHSEWPTHRELTRRFRHPHFHEHMVVYMNRSELIWRRCYRNPALDEQVLCPGSSR